MQDSLNSVDEILDHWHSQVIQILDDVAPVKLYPWRRNRLPWLSQDVRDLMTKRDLISKKIASNVLCLEDAAATVGEVQELRRRIKSRNRRRMREAGKEAIDVQDHKGAWRYIRAATFTTPKGGDALFDLAGMNEHFAEVVNSDENEPIVIDGCDQEDSFNFQIVSTQSVARLLGAVKTNTAMRSDGIPGFLVKKNSQWQWPRQSQIFSTKVSLQIAFHHFGKRQIFVRYGKEKEVRLNRRILGQSPFYLCWPVHLRD